MANPEHLEILKNGVEAWNQWRVENSSPADLSRANLTGPNLSGLNLLRANLFGANLSGASLQWADLSEANLLLADLTGANLLRANLRGANLSGADLSGANLGEANLLRTDLSGAKLLGADLTGANLLRANLIGANLGEARLLGANLGEANLDEVDLTESICFKTLWSDVNLSSVRGLEAIRHIGPSTIDFRTLTSSWPLPLSFLRGCGLPDQLIDYLPSLLNLAIQFHSCFISYSTKDQKFADRLYSDLQNKGVRCWFAPHDIQGGKKIHEQIDEAIKIHEKLLLILSTASMESEWVKTEISKARKREIREKRRVLFPIRLVSFETLRDWDCFDADTGKDSAREIREFFIPDFSNWKNHDDYQEAFQRLTRDLKAEHAASV
jgi:hypothetical protein